VKTTFLSVASVQLFHPFFENNFFFSSLTSFLSEFSQVGEGTGETSRGVLQGFHSLCCFLKKQYETNIQETTEAMENLENTARRFAGTFANLGKLRKEAR
jgi:hypothetical protein